MEPSGKAWTRIRRELVAAFEQQRPPDFSRLTPEKWVKTLDRLLGAGEIDLASHAIRCLAAHAPELDWPRNIGAILDRLPAGAPGRPPFADDETLEVQSAPSPGADTVILVFCGVRDRIGMPTPLFHRWMERLGCSVIYLRDFQRAHFLKGVRSLAEDRAGSVKALKSLAAELGARRILCLGNSSGGYGALLYGLELGAEAVLSFSGPSNLEPEFNEHLNRRDSAERLREALPAQPLDLKTLYLTGSTPPRPLIVYGEFSWDDRLHAEHMAEAPAAELISIPGFLGHGTVAEMIRRGEMEALLDRFNRRN